MINEYHLDAKELETGGGSENDFVLCHLKNYEKNESIKMCYLLPKNGNISSSKGSKSMILSEKFSFIVRIRIQILLLLIILMLLSMVTILN